MVSLALQVRVNRPGCMMGRVHGKQINGFVQAGATCPCQVSAAADPACSIYARALTLETMAIPAAVDVHELRSTRTQMSRCAHGHWRAGPNANVGRCFFSSPLSQWQWSVNSVLSVGYLWM